MENQYDAFGLRISVTENGIGSNFTYDRGNIITETNGSGNLVSRNIRGLGLIARENAIGTKAYYLNNAHGDVSKLVNENGEVLNSYQYDAFGNTTSSKEKVQNRFLYAGEQLDKVTGQYYLRARHYDPATGRFKTEDTYRGQLDNTKSLNLYTYCENNPIIYVDPSGHWTWDQIGNLAAGMYERVKDEGLNLLKINPISMLINAVKQWNALINQKITISELYAAGFESIVSDYKYVLDSKNKFVEAYTMFKCGASNKQVHNAGYHAVGILIDLATLAISVDKIVKAVKANRAAIKAAKKTGSGNKIKVNLQLFAKKKFPEGSISGKDVVKFLKKEGFTVVSQNGSHVKLNGLNGEVVIVPVHGNKGLPKGTLNNIKKQAGY